MRKEQVISTTNNNQMEEKRMKSRFIHLKKRFVPALSGALMGVMLMSTTCFAAGTGTSAVTQPLENLKTLIIAVIGAVGVIILAKNVMEFAQAYQQQDSSTMNSALKGIVAGGSSITETDHVISILLFSESVAYSIRNGL